VEDVLRVGIWFFVLAYSCILHECAHVYAALKLGDTTGRDLGRLTLNPIPHIDPIWTIALPVINYFTGAIPIAGPKPAPVNPLNFRDPRSGFMITSLAGPLSNILLCGLGTVLIWMLFHFAPGFAGTSERHADGTVTWTISLNALFLGNLIFTNLFLAAFNLIPIPPLDGSRFLQWLLGEKADAFMNSFSLVGFVILILGWKYISYYVIGPVATGAVILLANLLGQEYAFALVQGTFQR
jgi:Zn-dependent protease